MITGCYLNQLGPRPLIIVDCFSSSRDLAFNPHYACDILLGTDGDIRANGR